MVCADMRSSPLITIRNGCVSLVKHTARIYATHSFRIYVTCVTLAVLVPAPAAAAPWSAHVGEADRYAEQRTGEVSFGVRTERGLRGGPSGGRCRRQAS